MPEPSLIPVPRLPVGRSPSGRARRPGSEAPRTAPIQIHVPAVADRHVALVEREDGWWASEGQWSGLDQWHAVARNSSAERRRYAGGYARVPVPVRDGAAPAVAVGPVAAADPVKKRRRRRPAKLPGVNRPWAMISVLAAMALIIAVAVVLVLRTSQTARTSTPLTDAQSDEFDSLLVVADDHIERGNTLLELGLSEVAGQEFARGINTLAASSLRSLPQVKPRIEALEASVASIYHRAPAHGAARVRQRKNVVVARQAA